MREHPDGIRAVTIDGVAPPDAVTLGGFWISAREGLDSVFRACDADNACRSHYPSLASTFTGLVRNLETNPVHTSVTLPGEDTPVKVDVVLDGGALVNWMVRMVSNGQDRREVPHAIDQLAHGHPETVAGQWASFWVAPEFYGKSGYGLLYGVVCSERVPYEDQSQVLATGKQQFPDYPDSVLAQPPQIPFMVEDCAVWNVPKAAASVRQATQSAIPTLVLSGGFDAKTGGVSTPPARCRTQRSSPLLALATARASSRRAHNRWSSRSSGRRNHRTLAASQGLPQSRSRSHNR
jgi:hypothetical protein